jgi:D-inositol-3-phosphate glycosyltransferase
VQRTSSYHGEHEKRALVDIYGSPPNASPPCGVDLALPRRRRPPGASASKNAVLFVGRMEPLKGIEVLLSAAARLDDDPAFRVLVVGGDNHRNAGDELTHLKSLSADLGIADRVSFTGPVGHDVLPLYYSAADVCVVPSYYESFGLAALEAMACGTPVIASRVGGLCVTVRDGGPATWCRSSAAALRRPHGNAPGRRRLRRSFGRSASESVRGYGWGNVADQIESIYRRLPRSASSI